MNEKHGLSFEAVDLRKRLAVLAGKHGLDDVAHELRLEAYQIAERDAAKPGVSAGTILIFAGIARDLFLAGSAVHRQAAIEACRQVESGIEPMTPQLWYWAGCVYEDLGEAQEAKRCLGEALDRMPPGVSPLRDAIAITFARIQSIERTR